MHVPAVHETLYIFQILATCWSIQLAIFKKPHLTINHNFILLSCQRRRLSLVSCTKTTSLKQSETVILYLSYQNTVSAHTKTWQPCRKLDAYTQKWWVKLETGNITPKLRLYVHSAGIDLFVRMSATRAAVVITSMPLGKKCKRKQLEYQKMQQKFL